MRHARQNAHINEELPYLFIQKCVPGTGVPFHQFKSFWSALVRVCTSHHCLANKYFFLSPSIPPRVECDLLDLNIRAPLVGRHAWMCFPRRDEQDNKTTNQPAKFTVQNDSFQFFLWNIAPTASMPLMRGNKWILGKFNPEILRRKQWCNNLNDAAYSPRCPFGSVWLRFA